MAQLKLITFAKSASDVASALTASNLWGMNIVIQNIDGSNPVYIGSSTVADSSGLKLAAGASMTIDALLNPTGAKREISLKDIYAVCASGQTATLRIGYLSELNPAL